MRSQRKMSVLMLAVWTLVLLACEYIVLPEEDTTLVSLTSKGWSAFVTNVSTSDSGDLHIDITIRNETGAWSAMQADPAKPAVLTTGDGTTSDCETVFISSGGHRLAPGFQMRGFISGTKAEPITQLLYVECAGVESAGGSHLVINYSYVTGEYNYYDQESGKASDSLEISLDEVAADLQYPVAEPIDGLIQKSDVEIIALNECTLLLTGVTRSDETLKLDWKNSNPGEYPTYVHIGNPPVIGSDGIIYGLYESPDIASVPVTGAGDSAEWATTLTVPQDVHGLYILLSVESKKQRLFVNYAIDITDR
jgi:hypothetical protein